MRLPRREEIVLARIENDPKLAGKPAQVKGEDGRRPYQQVL